MGGRKATRARWCRATKQCVLSEQAADSSTFGLVRVDDEVSCSKGPSPDGEAIGMAKGAGRTVTGESIQVREERDEWCLIFFCVYYYYYKYFISYFY